MTPDAAPADAAARETLHGEIEKVIYANAENGYQVMVLADSRGVRRTVCGTAPGIEAGMLVDLSGEWREHKDYGRQFCFTECLPALPTGATGICRFLGSGIIPGIGPKLAAQIVDYFGDDTIDVLDNHVNRLAELPGFGPKKLKKVRENWKKYADRRNGYIFLQGLGITPVTCARLYARYGENAAATIRAKPYDLAYDVDGFGFQKADQLARKVGFSEDAPERLAAGAVYALDNAAGEGHTCFPEEDLLLRAADLLRLDPEMAQAGVETAIAAKRMIRDRGMLYLPAQLRAERELPRHVARLAGAVKRPAAKLTQIPAKPGLTLSDEQLGAVAAAGKQALSIITGGPGVGKTTVLGELVRRARAARLKILLAAPTGRAAKRLSEAAGLTAKTIHRLLQYDPALKGFQYNFERQLEVDLLLVDEVSMLDLPLALALFRAVPTGATVVLIGDADQLPSVGVGQILEDFLHSAWFKVSRLTKIFRQQAESAIIANAHRVNQGYLPQNTRLHPGELSDFYWLEAEEPAAIAEKIDKLLTRIPERFGFDPVNEVQILTPMNRGPLGTAALNAAMQSRFNPGERPAVEVGERWFKWGDKVMQTTNNYDKNVFNGDLGRIVHVDPAKRALTVAFEDGREVNYVSGELDELTLAYAITVHKSQGCEFPAVLMPVSTQHYMLLRRNLLYTGMTRAKKLLILIGSRKAMEIAVGNQSRERRYGLLRERLAELKELLEHAGIPGSGGGHAVR